MPDISIVFRALNEEKWFDQALRACKQQQTGDLTTEIILVDSGSTDRTLEIAAAHGCKTVHIQKSEFTFGRSLNMGCRAASGKYLIFISAHCIPEGQHWLRDLVQPLIDSTCDYTYGRQVGHETSRFSEKRLFKQYYPEFNRTPQDGFFCNNANAAISRTTWEKYKFDEDASGLEDMVLGRQIVMDGGKIGYVASASVIHIHEETFKQTRNRYYRESITLRGIMPEVHLTRMDSARYFTTAVFFDLCAAAKQNVFFKVFGEIFAFRYNQYKGSYLGHNELRRLSRAQKEAYFYPQPATEKNKRPEPALKPHDVTKIA